jgi:elongator complex protein 2
MIKEAFCVGKGKETRHVHCFAYLIANLQKMIYCYQWNCAQRINAHNGSISVLALNGNYVVTGSSNGDVKLWKQVSGEFLPFFSMLCKVLNSFAANLTEMQTISLQGKFPLSLSLSTLPNSEGL